VTQSISPVILLIPSQCLILLAFRTEAHTSNRTHSNRNIRIPLFERGSDQITHAPVIIIVLLLNIYTHTHIHTYIMY